jgi:endo-1,4-beta-xylanase
MSFRDLTTLKGAAEAAGVLYGTVVNKYYLADATLAAFVAGQNRILVAESEMKMNELQPTQGVFSFTDADAIASFAQNNGMALRFHALIWHNGLPAWASAAIASNWQSVMDAHISGVAGRYTVRSCDVCNEVIGEDGSGWRTDSAWYQAAGSIDYVKRAFEKAAIHLPIGAKKMLAEYGIIWGDDIEAKSAKLVELATTLKAEGTIDGVSIQGHLALTSGGNKINHANFADTLDALGALGLEVNITELDVANFDPLHTETTFKMVSRDIVREVLEIWVASGLGGELLQWCIKQDKSWMHDAFGGQYTQWPGAFNASYARNPLFYGIRQALTD